MLWSAKHNNLDDEGAKAAFNTFQERFFPVENIQEGGEGQGKRKEQPQDREAKEGHRPHKKAKATVKQSEAGGSGKQEQSTAVGKRKTRRNGGAMGKQRAVDSTVDLSAEVQSARDDLDKQFDVLMDLADVQRKTLEVQAAAIQALKDEVVYVEVQYEKQLMELRKDHAKNIQDLREDLEKLKVEMRSNQ